MSKKETFAIVSLALVVIVASAGAYWFFYLRGQNKSVTSVAAATSLATPPAENIPLGQDRAESQTSDLSVTGNSGGFQSDQRQTIKSNKDSQEGQTYNPPTENELKEYEKYKSATNALFGDIINGTGTEAVANKKITVYYRGWLLDGKVFDESTQDKPFSFTLGARQVIPGWDQAIAGMKVGGIRRLIVPPAAGYGAQQQGGIPPNSILVFDVQLLSVE